MIYQHIKGLFPDEFNQTLIDQFRYLPFNMDITHTMGVDYPYDMPENIWKNKDSGFSYKSFIDLQQNQQKQVYSDIFLFTGSLIFETAIKKMRYNIVEPVYLRSYVNYYNQGSYCSPHIDGDSDNISILYFLNTSKGSYTEIEGERIYGESGDCVIFDSNNKHYASGAVDDPTRWTFNIMAKHKGIYNA